MSDFNDTDYQNEVDYYSDFHWFEALPRRVRMVRFTGRWEDLPVEARADSDVKVNEFGWVLVKTDQGWRRLLDDWWLVIGTANEKYMISPPIQAYKYRFVDDEDDPNADAAFEAATEKTMNKLTRAAMEKWATEQDRP